MSHSFAETSHEQKVRAGALGGRARADKYKNEPPVTTVVLEHAVTPTRAYELGVYWNTLALIMADETLTPFQKKLACCDLYDDVFRRLK